ncbi:MAG: S8 family serine peptidase [Candidatus Melainabacteria bacterium]|nr:S8 family serine peptidase [Candidatus Melainabacteria bacterium]
MFLNRLYILILIFSISNFPNTLSAKKVIHREFSCNENSKEIIADGIIVKFKDSEQIAATNISSETSVQNKLSRKKNLKLKQILSGSDAEIAVKISKLQGNKKLKALARLEKLKQFENDYKFNQIFTIQDDHKLTCKELKNILNEYKDSDEVDNIEPNFIREIMSPVSLNQDLSGSYAEDQAVDRAWGVDQIKAKAAWQISKGAGVKVAMIDSGIDYNHPSLWGNIWVDTQNVKDNNYDGFVSLDDADINANGKIDSDSYENEIQTSFNGNIFGDYYESSSVESPEDGFGHGSHVAGIIAAKNSDSEDFNGVASEAKLIAIKIFDNQGRFTSVTELLRGIRSSIIDGAKVINASIGGSYYSKLEEDTYKLADSLGVVVVAAAGNSNSNNDYQPVYPASYETVLSVAASDKTDSIASFSNYGESVDVSAPGSQIPSTMNNQSYLAERLPLNFVKNINEEHGIWLLSGTSMATPHVAGLTALILSKNPELNPSQVREIIKNSTDQISGDKQTLCGRVNALNALNLATNFSNEANVNLKEVAKLIFTTRSSRNKKFSGNLSKNSLIGANLDIKDETIAQVLKAINAVDINLNGIVGTTEIERFKQKLNKTKKYFKRLDVNEDGSVNSIDETYIKYVYSLIDINLS